MQEFEIEIEEILQKVLKVEADSKEEAIRIAKKKYRNEEIILEAEDLKETNIRMIK